jgi:hypothetical protein
MAYNPGQFQESLTSTQYHSTTTDVVSIKQNNYNAFYSSLNTSPTGKIQVKSDGTIQEGYRVDISDVKDVFAVGDIIQIAGLTYTVKEVVKPELDTNTGKYVSPIILGEENALPVFPDTERSYLIDITVRKDQL